MVDAPSMLSVPLITQRALASSLSRPCLPIIAGSLAVSAAVVVGLWFLSSWLIHWMINGWVSWQWLIAALQSAAAIGVTWLIFPLLVPMFISMFVNQLAARINAHEYIDRPQGKDMPFFPELAMDMKFAGYALLLNIVILPIYLIPGLNLMIYYALNAHLLGKQYFMMVARRHIAPIDLKANMHPYRSRIYLYGLVIVVASTVPVMNLLAPVFATALMVHVYHRLFYS